VPLIRWNSHSAISAASDSNVEIILKHVEVGLQDFSRGEVLEIFVITRGEIIQKHVEIGLQEFGRGEVLEIFVITREIIEELSVLQG